LNELPAGLSLRRATDEDWWGVVALVAACWSEYPGCVVDVHGECPDLLAPASHYAGAGGGFWVVNDACGTVVGAVGWKPGESGAVKMERLYVSPRWRRLRVAGGLAGLVESVAVERGAPAVELWSDTRFAAAHAFYMRRGYERLGPDRSLGDLSNTVEHHFVRDVGAPASGS